MNEQNSSREGLELAAQVLIRCFVGSLILMLLWFIPYLCATDWMYAMNARWFSITREQFVLVNYCGIAVVKLFGILVFLIPYVCLRLVLRKNR